MAKPQLIIIDRIFDNLAPKDIELMLSQLIAKKNTLLIIITKYPNLISLPNCVVFS